VFVVNRFRYIGIFFSQSDQFFLDLLINDDEIQYKSGLQAPRTLKGQVLEILNNITEET